MTARDDAFAAEARALGYAFDGEIKAGGNYVPVVREGRTLYVSGQIPRVGDAIVCIGAAGGAVSLEQAQDAARVCAMRALALLQRALGSLQHVESVARVGVYVRSAPDFMRQSEVADAASDLLARVLGPSAAHSRTSIGVLQLPKGATVELDMIAIAAQVPAAKP